MTKEQIEQYIANGFYPPTMSSAQFRRLIGELAIAALARSDWVSVKDRLPEMQIRKADPNDAEDFDMPASDECWVIAISFGQRVRSTSNYRQYPGEAAKWEMPWDWQEVTHWAIKPTLAMPPLPPAPKEGV